MALVMQTIPDPIIVHQPVVQPMAVVQSPPPVAVIQSPPPVAVIQSPPPVAIVQPPGPVVVQSPMKSLSASTQCPFCQKQVVTMTRPINGLITWVIAGTLFVFGIWPFCVIPFFVKSCKDIQHICPQCKNVITVYKRM